MIILSAFYVWLTRAARWLAYSIIAVQRRRLGVGYVHQGTL